jgi:hypothetical protein
MLRSKETDYGQLIIVSERDGGSLAVGGDGSGEVGAEV